MRERKRRGVGLTEDTRGGGEGGSGDGEGGSGGEEGRGMITHKYMGSQQFSRVEYSTQIYKFDTRERRNICKY